MIFWNFLENFVGEFFFAIAGLKSYLIFSIYSQLKFISSLVIRTKRPKFGQNLRNLKKHVRLLGQKGQFSEIILIFHCHNNTAKHVLIDKHFNNNSTESEICNKTTKPIFKLITLDFDQL
jgi:hypothetical protein